MRSYCVGYQELEWLDRKRNRSLLAALWYPTEQVETPVTYLAHFHSQAGLNAPFVENKFPLVILSHGSRGHRYNQYYLAEFLARSGYIVVAIEHTGDTAFDDALSESNENHAQRLNDVVFIYQQLTQHLVIGKYIDEAHIAHIGHSFGGFTSFVLAGGLSKLIPDKLNKIVPIIFQDKLKCIVMLAPALSETLQTQSEKLSTPALLVTAEEDELLGNSSDLYLQYFKFIEPIVYPNTGHFIFLMSCPEAVALECPEVAHDHGTPRALIHPKLNASVKTFLENHLKC